MDRAQWNAISAIFDAAMELPSNEREAFVQSNCNGDAVVASEVLDMLAADRSLEGSVAGENFLKPLDFPKDALESFLTSPPPFKAGEVIRGRFRIVRPVGEGGMGHVFEAWDEELGIRVALKAIRSEISNHAESLARFRREARVGLQASHPNICRIFQIDHDIRRDDIANAANDRVYFFTMEFLDGETLAVRLARTGTFLPYEEVLAFARQIAAALDCAHDLGVVHRDIKPANVMLVPPTPPSRMATAGTSAMLRAVVTDFGLAYLDPLLSDSSSSTLSRTGFAPGTLRYMAPEQLEGGQISPATDVYAFGLLLFEMVTGERAYRSSGSRPLPRKLNPGLPSQWDDVIERCLDPEPTARYPRASDAVDAITGDSLLRPHLTRKGDRYSSPSNRFLKLVWQRLLRKPAIYSACFALTVAPFIFVFRYTSQPPPLPAGALVYLAPVNNRTGEKSLDNLTGLIQASLTQSAHINLLDQGRVGDILQQMTKAPDSMIDPPSAREIALRAGAARVVFGSISRSTSGYKLDIEIQKPDAGSLARARLSTRKSWTWRTENQSASNSIFPRDLLINVRDASIWVRREVGESANDIARLDTPPEDVTTDNWEALEHFVHADELNRAHRTEDALVALQNSLKADPQFALAYGRLGDLEVSLGRTAEGFTAYRRALETSLDRRLTRREIDRIRGIYASDSWDYGTAEEAFRDFTVFYPNDFSGWFYRALPLMRLGRYEEAKATLQRAEQVAPGNPYVPYDAGLCALERGEIAEAKNWVGALRDRGQLERSQQLAGIEALLSGDPLGAKTQFEALRNSSIENLRLQGYALLTRLWAEKGDSDRALSSVRAGRIEAEAQGAIAERARFLMDEASLLCGSAQWVLCADHVRQGVELDASPELLLQAGEVLGQAMERASHADRRRLRAELEHVSQVAPRMANNRAYDVVQLRLQAERLAADHHVPAALVQARRAVVLDQQYRRHEQLARLLLRASAQSRDVSQRGALREEARQALSLSALHPTAVWLQSQLYRPGAWSEDVRLYKLEFGSHTGNTSIAIVLPLFEHLQPAPSPPLP